MNCLPSRIHLLSGPCCRVPKKRDESVKRTSALPPNGQSQQRRPPESAGRLGPPTLTDQLPANLDHDVQEPQNLVHDDLVYHQVRHTVDDTLDQLLQVPRLSAHPFHLPEQLALAEFPIAVRQPLAVVVQSLEDNGEQVAFCEAF